MTVKIPNEYPLRHLNRVRSKQPTKSKWWCGNCDAHLIGDSGKCPVCGIVNSNKFKR